MTELLTTAQMRAIEQAAIKSGSVCGLELMERAGNGVVDAIFEEWPGLAQNSYRAVVLCGPGNNGGDGFVIARLLNGWGWAVDVYLLGQVENMPPDARLNYDRWCEIGSVTPLVEGVFDRGPAESLGADLIIDALFGTGLTRPFHSHKYSSMAIITYRALLRDNGTGPKVVAVDAPSGLCTDSGVCLGNERRIDFAVAANLTVSFHSKKAGHVLADGPLLCGKVVVKDIGLQRDAAALDLGQQLQLAEPLCMEKSQGHHKYSHGHALIFSGGPGRTGAARLAARGALRVGAGLVTLAVPPAAQLEVATQVTSIMLTRVSDGPAAVEILADGRLNALCLGPGLGLARAVDLVGAVLGDGAGPRPTVLDADALSGFSEQPDTLFSMLHKDCVLTPHAGEFARIFPDIAQRLNALQTVGPAYSKVDATRDAAARAGCVVLFKGPDTVIAAPDGQCSVHAASGARAAPWLATAGSGDILAGFITGLLARGFSPFDAAQTAAWMHVECALNFGPGLIAEDLPEQIPAVLRRSDAGRAP